MIKLFFEAISKIEKPSFRGRHDREIRESRAIMWDVSRAFNKTKPYFSLLLVFSICATWGVAQKALEPTAALRIHGTVKKDSVFSGPDFLKLPARVIGDVVITNHLGEPRGTARQMKGILLKEVLRGIEIDSPSPKDLSAFYLICRASDGYEVVFSWNEIFNSPTGDAVFLVTEKDGKKLSDMEDAILLISPTDMRTGRRFVKSLAEIEFARVRSH